MSPSLFQPPRACCFQAALSGTKSFSLFPPEDGGPQRGLQIIIRRCLFAAEDKVLQNKEAVQFCFQTCSLGRNILLILFPLCFSERYLSLVRSFEFEMSCGLVMSYIWACWLLATGVLSQNAFSTPPAPGPNLNFLNNQIYAIGELLNIQYCQDMDTLYDINLWQQGNTVDETPFSEYSMHHVTITRP